MRSMLLTILSALVLVPTAFSAPSIQVTKNGQNVLVDFMKMSDTYVFSLAGLTNGTVEWTNKLDNQQNGCDGTAADANYTLVCSTAGTVTVQATIKDTQGVQTVLNMVKKVSIYNGTWNGNTGAKVQEFHITKGTGKGDWNTPETAVTLTVGQTLNVINDDTIDHQMHTNGVPCAHGNLMTPGKSDTCVITSAYNSVTNGGVYDHLNDIGKFNIITTKP